MKKHLVLLLLLSIIILFAAPHILYKIGLSYMGVAPEAPLFSISKEEELEIWGYLHTDGKPRLNPIGPYRFLKLYSCGFNENEAEMLNCTKDYPSFGITLAITQMTVYEKNEHKGGIKSALAWFSSAIWVSNNWNINQLLSKFYELMYSE